MSAEHQNNSQGTDKKAQLSWSQPITTPSQPKSSSPMSKDAIPEKNNTFRNVSIAVVVLAIVGIIWAVAASHTNTDGTSASTSTIATTTPKTNNTSGTATTGTSNTPAPITDGSLSIPTPQTAGTEVAVSGVVVSVPTWVVVYENINGKPGNVLGAALFVQDRTSGTVELLRATLPGQTYFAGESRDNGDHMYSMQNDAAVRDTDGNPISVQFQTK